MDEFPEDAGNAGERPDVNDPLMLAARYNDADSEERGFEGTIAKLGLDLDNLIYVAEQRAMRLILLKRGGPEELKRLYGPGFKQIPMTEAERSEVAFLTTMYLDGICIGYRAANMKEDEDGPSKP